MPLYRLQTTIPTKFRVCDSIVAASGVQIPVLEGRMSRSEVPSEKGYRYRRGFWTRIIEDPKVQEKIASRDMLGCIEHPEDDDAYMNTPYEEASHIILRAWVKDDEPYARIGLLNNDKGNKIKALTDIGHRPGASTRALGGYEDDEKGKYVPEDRFAFITWDIVNAPNFGTVKMDKVSDSLASSPLFKEVVQMYHLRDSVDEHYDSNKLKADMELALGALQRIQNHLKL